MRNNADIILEFISQNRGITENKVAEFMTKNHFCARPTTLKLISEELIPSRKITDKRIGNSFHRLYINDKNEHNKLIAQIDGIQNMVNSLTELANTNNTKGSSRDIFFKEHIPTLVQLKNLAIFWNITNIVTSIQENITSNQDREALYSRLVNVLKTSNELNKLIIPEVTARIKRMTDDFKKVKAVKNSNVSKKIDHVLRNDAINSNSDLT